MIDVKETLAFAEEKMEEAVMYLDDSLARIRAGKANIKILDGIRVDSYGSMVPLNNVAAINTPDPRTIAIKPWDKTMFKAIEKAIINSEVGIMPDNNGEIIRLNIPPLTEERRKQLVKQCGKEEEQAKISVRNARRDILEKLKKGIKDGLAEDAEKDAEGCGGNLGHEDAPSAESYGNKSQNENKPPAFCTGTIVLDSAKAEINAFKQDKGSEQDGDNLWVDDNEDAKCGQQH